ncbi:LuxR C-terminal-related transcriptional regulator [Streptomyces geranii]|uniref:LuxR C-terminal-related transcriptional regulator n=1 Tax=Streptomyces geranii TaxID=2058923 RepID=UPI000D042365|nr:LuxR C-terminal-related transcriptional regulator [Streptomyces geranii]
MAVGVLRAGNLPEAFTEFVGRRSEVDDVRRLLETQRLVTLTGVGGIGKTRLALVVASSLREVFPDGVWLVDLAAARVPPVEDAGTRTVATAVAMALGVPDLGTRPVLEQMTARLAGHRALIVLDNCEEHVHACGELTEALLSAAGQLRVLTTSRQALGIGGEHLYSVPPLRLDEAVELLGVRTAAVRPEFRLSQVGDGAVTRLCADLDGIPLAIELAASRLRTLTVEQLSDRLTNRFALLTGGSRTALPRHRTLRATVEWSYELCSPEERLLWARLSVFPESFSLEAAEGVCSGDGLEACDVLDLLSGLINQSVLLTTEAEGFPRYRMLETIRQYGRERLVASGAEETLRLRHRDFHIAIAEHVADHWYGPGQQQALARLRADHTDLMAALDCPGDAQATLVLAGALSYHWCLGGFLREGRHRLDAALAAAPEPTPARAQALLAVAWTMLLLGDPVAAHRCLDEAEDLGAVLGDPTVRPNVLHMRGALAWTFQKEPKQAMALLEQVVADNTGLGQESQNAMPLFQLSFVQLVCGDPRGTGTAERALAVAERYGDQWGRAHALWAMSNAAALRAEPCEAMEYLRSALEIQQDFADYMGAAFMLEDLAVLTSACRDHERAARQLGAADAVWREIGATLSAFPHLVERHTRCEEEIVRAVGRGVYEEAFAAGRAAKNRAEAIALALDIVVVRAATDTSVDRNPLSLREQEVVELVAQGLSNKQIATRLFLSPRTVDRHMENIRAKLSSFRRTQIAAWWVENQPATAPFDRITTDLLESFEGLGDPCRSDQPRV